MTLFCRLEEVREAAGQAALHGGCGPDWGRDQVQQLMQRLGGRLCAKWRSSDGVMWSTASLLWYLLQHSPPPPSPESACSDESSPVIWKYQKYLCDCHCMSKIININLWNLSISGRYHSIRATCVVKFWFFGKNPSGPFIHITWYHLNCPKTSKGASSRAF